MKNRSPQLIFRNTIIVLLLAFLSFDGFANKKLPFALINAGTYSVGPTGTYLTISAAISAINTAGGITGPVILELQNLYAPIAETLVQFATASAINTITIRPIAGTTKLISSTSTTPTLQINGGKFYIIDGQAGGTGGNKDLTIVNTNTATGAAIRFKDDASNNVIKYCNLKGQSTSLTNAVVLFAGTAGSTGNDNNTITNCDITSVAAAALSTNGIYSSGTAAKANDANTISNCNIYDIFNAGAKSVGILMEANTVGWTVSNNSFYQTAARTTSALWEGIELNNKANGNGFTIANNFIGGLAPLAIGGLLTFTFTTTGYFSGISVYGFSGTANVVSGNVIKNVFIICDQRNLHYGIYHSDGAINITGNAIGDLTTTGSITFSSSAPTVSFVSPAFAGICAGGGSTIGSIGGNVNIQNNNIGSIFSKATGLGANEFRGIFYQGAATLTAPTVVVISGNIIGGTLSNKSISNEGNGATVGIVINAGYTIGGVKHIVKDNTVQNILTLNTILPAQGSLEGITTQGIANKDAAYIVDNNIIKNLTASNPYTMVGFKTSATVAPQLITKNKIFNLRNLSNLAGSNVVGIELGYDFVTSSVTPSAIASELSRNIISNLEISATVPAAGSVAWGLSAYAGRFNIFNNMIAMGYGVGNIDITKPYEITGIANNGVGISKPAYFNFYYNTVHIGGAGAAASSPESKCYFGNNYGTTDLKNNIFYNSRTNAAGTTNHYSFLYTNTGTTTSDYNVLSAIGINGIVAGYYAGSTTNYATTDALFAAKAIDANSFSAPVKFVDNATDLRCVPSPDVTNFFIANEALPIAGYTTDIDGNTRNSYFPDMGCFEFKGTGCWIGQTSSAWNNTTLSGNWDDGVIPPSTWDVKIFPNVDPAITQPNIISAVGTATVKDLYLRTTTRATTNSSLVTVNTGILQIYGDVKFRKNAVYSGAIDARLGTIDMKGSVGNQTLSPRWFVKTEIETLINSNAKSLTITAPTVSDTMLISKALLYGAATTGSLITTNDNLTLLSRATGTARFGEIVSGSGNTIVGKVNVERFIPNTRKWRLLAWPTVSSQTAQTSWMEGSLAANDNLKPGYGCIITDEQNNWATRKFDSKSISGPSVKYYDVTNDKYIGIPNTDLYAMNTNSAYYIYVRGDRTALPTPYTNSNTVLRTKGTLLTGTVNYPVTNTKYAAIGNPFASPIDLKKMVGTNLTTDIYLWDPKITGMYGLGAYQVLSKSGGGVYRIMPGGGSYPPALSQIDTIESGMGMFVRSNGMGTGNAAFSEDAKTISARSLSRAAGTDQAEVCYALLSIVDPTENTLVDGAMVAFDDAYSNNVDYDDATKFTNTSENVSFKRQNTLLAIERRKDVVADDTLYLNATGLRIKNYQWAVNVAHMTNPGRTAFFIDKFLNTITALDLEGATNINFYVTSQAATYAADRFMIVFKQIQRATSMYATISAVRNADKTVKVSWGVANESFTNNYDIQQSSDGINFARIGTQLALLNNNSNTAYSYNDNAALLSNNWYRIKLNANNGTAIYSSIAMVNGINAEVVIVKEAKINIYPNPVVNGTVNVVFENQPKGNYTISITNKAGLLLQAKTIQIMLDYETSKIKLADEVAGSYQITIIDVAGKKTTIPFVIK